MVCLVQLPYRPLVLGVKMYLSAVAVEAACPLGDSQWRQLAKAAREVRASWSFEETVEVFDSSRPLAARMDELQPCRWVVFAPGGVRFYYLPPRVAMRKMRNFAANGRPHQTRQMKQLLNEKRVASFEMLTQAGLSRDTLMMLSMVPVA